MTIPGAFPVGSEPTGSGGSAGGELVTDALTDGLTFIDLTPEVTKIVARQLADSAEFSEQLEFHEIAVLIEKLSFSESFATSWEGLSILSETVQYTDVLSIFLSDQLTDNIDFTDLWSSYGLLVVLADVMRFTGVTSTMLETQEVLAEALAFKETLEYFMAAELADGVSFTETFEDRLTAINQMLDGVLISDALTYDVVITALIDEKLDFNEEITSTAEMLRLLEDSIAFGAKLTSDTGVYEAWTMNTMTGGATLYDNFPFNSFALHTNNKYLGATDDGIYELAGADDDGTSINAGFKTGLMDFGSTLSKRMVDAWFTMTAEGDMLLKTTTVEDNGKVERWYLVKKTPRMHRAKMAKGVKAMFWQFELTNIDGKDFDVDNMALHPLPLNRRY